MGGIVLVDVGLGYLQSPAVGCTLTEERIGHSVVRFAGCRIDREGRYHVQFATLVLVVEPFLAEGKVMAHGVSDGQHRLYVVGCIECHVIAYALHGGAIDTQGILQQHQSGTVA